MEIMPIAQIVSKFYLRVHVTDELGVLAGISKILAQHRISVKSVIQKEDDACKEGTIDIVLITHEALEAGVQNALIKINQQTFIAGETQLIRINNWGKKSMNKSTKINIISFQDEHKNGVIDLIVNIQ